MPALSHAVRDDSFDNLIHKLSPHPLTDDGLLKSAQQQKDQFMSTEETLDTIIAMLEPRNKGAPPGKDSLPATSPPSQPEENSNIAGPRLPDSELLAFLVETSSPRPVLPSRMVKAQAVSCLKDGANSDDCPPLAAVTSPAHYQTDMETPSVNFATNPKKDKLQPGFDEQELDDLLLLLDNS